MSFTTTDLKALPNLVDDDSRNLAIVYGSLGTLNQGGQQSTNEQSGRKIGRLLTSAGL
jgi:hypothetical protein